MANAVDLSCAPNSRRTAARIDLDALLSRKTLIFVQNSTMTASKDISAAILRKVKELVKATDPEAEVILFGSRARGDAKEDSDWDILILTPKAVNLKVEQVFRHKLFELELEFGQAISTFVYSKADWNGKHRATPFYHNIEEEGILI
jgi:predicted nucleotidyltransferase